MFTIDNALQKHWRSCSSALDRASVNDNALRQSDIQESILSLNFSQMLPKSISDKVLAQLGNNKDDKDKGGAGGGRHGKRFLGANTDNKEDVVYDNDKSNKNWKLKEDENFGKVFYAHQKDCPKTSEGKLICMKFFLRGVCMKTCNRVHSLAGDDKKKFDAFIKECRNKASKSDFP